MLYKITDKQNTFISTGLGLLQYANNNNIPFNPEDIDGVESVIGNILLNKKDVLIEELNHEVHPLIKIERI